MKHAEEATYLGGVLTRKVNIASEISEKDSFCHGIREKYNALYYEVSKIQPPGGTSHGSRMMVRGSGMIIEV